MQTRCPNCQAPGTDLRICYPTWYTFALTDGELDDTTVTHVDTEAAPRVFCESCDTTWENVKNFDEVFGIPDGTPTLDQWIAQNAAKLELDVATHVECLSTLEGEEAETLTRCIMTSIRQYVEKHT